MPLNNSYDEQAVIQAIASALETFYGTLIEKIDGLNIQKVMKRKNPYLYRAKAMQSATEIVDSVLTAFVSSSEETIFGNCFFEPIAIAASGGNKALAEGIDIMIQNKEIDAGGGGIDQVRHGAVAAGLQDIVKADEVALDVGIRIGDGVPDSGLGGQIHHHIGFPFGKDAVHSRPVGNIALHKGPDGAGMLCGAGLNLV